MSRVLPAAARSLALALALLACWDLAAEAQVRPALTAEEKAAGWQLLFDGQSLAGWRGFKAPTPPASWRAIEGALARVADAGDLMTTAQYGDFELVFDWKISPGGNSGVFFHVAADDEAIWTTGPEMQVLDNKGHSDGKDPITSAGSNFAVHAPRRDVTRPVGEWNTARLVVKRPHVEHWLNGEKVSNTNCGAPTGSSASRPANSRSILATARQKPVTSHCRITGIPCGIAT